MITASVRKLGPSGGRVLVQVVSVAGFTAVVAVIYLVVVLGIGAVPRNSADREILGLSMLAAAAAAVGYCQQGTGWSVMPCAWSTERARLRRSTGTRRPWLHEHG